MKRRSQKNPHAVSILNNPQLLQTVCKKKQNEPPADSLVAQVGKLREIYRILRDKSFIEQTLPSSSTVRDELSSLFPKMNKSAIDFAIHIEEKTSVLPMELFQLWTQVEEHHLRNLIANSLLDDMDIHRAYVLVGLYLWARVQGYEPSSSKEFKFDQNQTEYMYKSMGVSKSVGWRLLRENGLSPLQTKVNVSGAIQTRSQFTIQKESILSRYCRNQTQFKSVRYNRGKTPTLDIPEYEDLLARFNGYALLYPSDHYGTVHPVAPFIYYDGDTLRVPLTPGIVPALVGSLFTPEQLGWLFNSMEARQRNQKVRTVLKKASIRIREIDKKLQRFNYIAIHLPARHLDKRHDVLRVFNTMTHNGVAVDEPGLDNVNLDKLDPIKHRIKDLHKERMAIKKFISSSPNGRLYGKYRFHVYSERIYTRNYNVQGLPNVYKPAIVSDSGRYFLYFDVIANDLSMLFHLSRDEEGLQLIRDGLDPYREIAKQAFPEKPLREKVKSFVNPWVYGAGIETIVKNSQGSDGEVTVEEANRIKDALSRLFIEATAWIDDVRWEVATHSRIPAELNRLDEIDVPMPSVLAPTRSAVFLIQRFGASLFRNILHLLAENGYEPAAFVHDSVLIHVPSSKAKSDAVRDVKRIIQRVLSIKHVEFLNVKIGSGSTWHEAERHAVPCII